MAVLLLIRQVCVYGSVVPSPFPSSLPYTLIEERTSIEGLMVSDATFGRTIDQSVRQIRNN